MPTSLLTVSLIIIDVVNIDTMASDRERGFLSKRDRRYLQGESDIEPKSAQERNVRRDIRERTRNAFVDFTLLEDTLREDDREQIFDRGDDIDEFNDGLADAIAFIFEGVSERPTSSGKTVYPESEYVGRGDFPSMEFLPLLYDGLYRGYMEFNIYLEGIELTTKATSLPKMQTTERKLRSGETLPPEYAALLLQSERIDPERFTEFAREELLKESADHREEDRRQHE